jgi:hypothetical protein
MMTFIHRRLGLLQLAAVVFAGALVVGCGPTAEIRSYTVAKEVATTPAAGPAAAPITGAKPDANAKPTDRMIGAILPSGEISWFFKATGPIAEMDQQADAITSFFNTVDIKPGAAKPEWKLPEAWKEQGASGMRVATLLIPAEEKPIEMSVMTASGDVLSNVNRWRGQMSLPHVDAAGLAKTVTEKKVGDATMTIVDLQGQFSNTMAAPFAGRGGPFSGGAQPPAGVGQGDVARPGTLPPGHPTIDPHGGTGESPLTFKAPKSWPASKPDGMRKAMFLLKAGEPETRVTAIDFPKTAGPKIADPLENINRWRLEVGLNPITKEELETAAQKIKIGGEEGHYAEMIPDAEREPGGKPARATIAAMVSAGDVIWFFKLTGERDLVTRERNNFKAFLDSARFTPADGADDGN